MKLHRLICIPDGLFSQLTFLKPLYKTCSSLRVNLVCSSSWSRPSGRWQTVESSNSSSILSARRGNVSDVWHIQIPPATPLSSMGFIPFLSKRDLLLSLHWNKPTCPMQLNHEWNLLHYFLVKAHNTYMCTKLCLSVHWGHNIIATRDLSSSSLILFCRRSRPLV